MTLDASFELNYVPASIGYVYIGCEVNSKIGYPNIFEVKSDCDKTLVGGCVHPRKGIEEEGYRGKVFPVLPFDGEGLLGYREFYGTALLVAL